jgi:calcium-dependent protein kinase
MGNCGGGIEEDYESDSLSDDNDDAAAARAGGASISQRDGKSKTPAGDYDSPDLNRKKSEKYPWVDESHIVNDVFALFEVEKELGRGASCRVLKVKNKETGKKSAMKEMVRNDKWNPMLFEQECKILVTLEGHPNILHYEDCYIDKKNFYVLTTLCTGGELFDKIKELRHFSERHAADVMKSLLDAMRYCHERNLVHRDLKPENIVYKTAAHEEIVVIDFGDAKEVEEHSVHEDFVGTAFYLAPEAIRTREGWELIKSDMWTIGVIAYVLVTGRPPFWGRENKEIIRKIVRGNVRFPSAIKLSDTCKDFILSLLQKEPEKRLSAVDALKHPWITGEDAVSCLDETVLFSLATFGCANLLKQLIVKTVAANLDRKHRKEYEQQFTSLDLKNDGVLDCEELCAFLIQCGLEEDDAIEKAERLVCNISGDAQKPITKQDWNHSNVAKLLSSEHLIERQYKKLDVDEDGLISADDLLSIFEGLSRPQICAIIEQVDLDCDGTISFAEFRRAMQFSPAYTEETEDY